MSFSDDRGSDGGFDRPLEQGPDPLPPRGPYEGTDNPAAAMQAYLDWE